MSPSYPASFPAAGPAAWGADGRPKYEGGAAFTGILDTLTDACVAAYGFRRLSGGGSGLCCRIRRSSDNAEQNFGFVDDGSGNQVVDTAGIATFQGGGDAFITTMYDHTANGHTSSQATAGDQPKFNATGGPNSKPAGEMTATTQVMDTNTTLPPLFDGEDNPITVGLVYTSVAGTNVFLDLAGSGSARLQFQSFGGSYRGFIRESGGTSKTSSGGTQVNGGVVATVVLGPTDSLTPRWYINNTNFLTVGNMDLGSIDYTQTVAIFGMAPIGAMYCEQVIWDVELSSGDLTTYRADQGSFYSITV